MSHMFDNYPQPIYYIPDNRKFHFPKDVITIMSGETTTHSFEVPFGLDDYIEDFKAIYKLGLEVVLEKSKEDCNVVYNETTNTSFLTWILSPEETMLFKDTLLDCQVQLKFLTIEDVIIYSEIYPIKLEDSLDKGDVL